MSMMMFCGGAALALRNWSAVLKLILMGSCCKSMGKPILPISRSSTNSTYKREKSSFRIVMQPASDACRFKKTDLCSVFQISSKELGHGQFGSVREARSVTDPSLRVALKSIPKAGKLSKIQATSEMQVWSQLDHPYITKFYDAIDDGDQYHIAVELCEGGDLSNVVKKMKGFSEREAKRVFLQIVLSVRHLHHRGITHRDIKLNNFLLKTKLTGSDVKLGDFGLACWNIEDKMTQIVGTPGYMAPELLKGKYNFKVDLWALGIVLYLLLCGEYPFREQNESDKVVDDPCTQKLEFLQDQWRLVSPEAKELVSLLLQENPDDRPECDQLIDSPWLNSIYTSVLSEGQRNLTEDLRSKLDALMPTVNLSQVGQSPVRSDSPVFKKACSQASTTQSKIKMAPAIFFHLENEAAKSSQEGGKQSTRPLNYSSILDMIIQ